jgi:phosphatidylserine/phosphatidylglycerophosphate/cardiolipin synthase-like enzyme
VAKRRIEMKPIRKSLIVLIILSLALLFGCMPAMIPTPVTNYSTISSSANNYPKIDVYFTQQNQHPELALAQLYNQATTSINVAIYSFTNPIIVKALTDAKKRGITVRVVTDKKQSAGKSQQVVLDILRLNDIPFKIDNHSGLMHLKMSIIDGKIATTGSFNYSSAASTDNDEMLVVIQDPNFVSRCQSEFDRMWLGNAKYLLDTGE